MAEAEQPRYFCYVCLKSFSSDVDLHVRLVHGLDPRKFPVHWPDHDNSNARRALYLYHQELHSEVHAQIQDAKRVAVLYNFNLDDIMLPFLKKEAIRLGIDLTSPPVNLTF
jgi:hypothetical protein